jgi:hypothetical protein
LLGVDSRTHRVANRVSVAFAVAISFANIEHAKHVAFRVAVDVATFSFADNVAAFNVAVGIAHHE